MNAYNPLRTTCRKTRCCLGPVSGICFIARTRKKFQTHLNGDKLKAQFDSSHETLRMSLLKSRACLQRYPDFMRFVLCPLAVSKTVQQVLVTIIIQYREGNRCKGERRLLSSSLLLRHRYYFIIPKKKKQKKKKKTAQFGKSLMYIIDKRGLKAKRYKKENHRRDIFPCIP